jgi:predicted RNA binding protein YcfA (HicA-like mRNA interferase family)
MPKLRRLNGKEVVKILEGFGFRVFSQKGSHIRLQRIVNGQEQRIVVPVHGNREIKIGTLKDIYNQAKELVSERELKSHFYTE